MPLTIIAIGKKHDKVIEEAIRRYEKRLTKPFDLKWEFLAHSPKNGLEARDEESQRISRRLVPTHFTVLLDERGRLIDSPTLSRHLVQAVELSRDVTLIIGGAYGVNDALRQQVDLVWSLSPLVFPHQLVRLILIEQLYRASTIYRGTSYHNE